MVNKPKPGYYASHPEKSQELTLLRAAKAGDTQLAQRAKHQLLQLNRGFLLATIESWRSKDSFLDLDELLQETGLAFLNAIENFNLDHDVSIRTYAKYYLRDLQRRYFKKGPKFCELADFDIQDTAPIQNLAENTFNLKTILRVACEQTLTPIEQEVVYLHYFEGMNKRKIAFERNCSESRICTIVKNALPKLRVYLKSLGIVPGFLELN